jgi:hypothetical protein
MVPRQPKFEGRCEELKGHIYDCSDARQSDIFAKTTKEIAVYVGRTYKYGSDAGLAVEKLDRPPLRFLKTLKRARRKQKNTYGRRKLMSTSNKNRTSLRI